MRFVALVSGGKDSIFAIQQAVLEVGHTLVACLHMARPPAEVEESYMYQSAASEVVRIQVEECLQVPYIQCVRRGTSQQTSLLYLREENGASSNMETALRDEVEDLYDALKLVLIQHPEVEAVCSGAILSTYQRIRVEHVVCQRLGLASLAYLWRQSSQQQLLQKMLASGLDAILVRTAAPPGLLPNRHLNRRLSELRIHFDSLHDKYQFHVCGEGGEYETLCVDSPLFHRTLVLDEVQVELDDPNDDTVGNLRILKCHTENKPNHVVPTSSSSNRATALLRSVKAAEDPATCSHQRPKRSDRIVKFQCLPHAKHVGGGLWHVSEITCPVVGNGDSVCDREDDLAVQEALGIFETLKQVLHRHSSTHQDVVMVHLYLKEMKLFARINQHYAAFFGSLLPPSRSCIAPASSSMADHRVSLDCLVQCKSGDLMRAVRPKGPVQRRQVLHVQSRSFWAPVCVGPYSQANTLWNALIYLAGQIGLDPPTMTLVHGGINEKCWHRQLQQSWMNLAQVLDALDNSNLPDNLLSCLIYVQHDAVESNADDCPTISKIHQLAREAVLSNGGVLTGLIDTGKPVVGVGNNLDGFEDEETRREALGLTNGTRGEHSNDNADYPAILVVFVAELPVDAKVEVEVVAATRKATHFLQRTLHPPLSAAVPMDAYFSAFYENQTWRWDTGQNDMTFGAGSTGRPSEEEEETQRHDVFFSSSFCSLGKGCAGYAVVTASMLTLDETPTLLPDVDRVMEEMIRILERSIGGSDLGLDQILHIRLYHLSALGDTASQLRMSLSSILGRNRPAVSLVPVVSMYLLLPKPEQQTCDETILLSMQVTMVDPNNLEAELWIRSDQ